MPGINKDNFFVIFGDDVPEEPLFLGLAESPEGIDPLFARMYDGGFSAYSLPPEFVIENAARGFPACVKARAALKAGKAPLFIIKPQENITFRDDNVPFAAYVSAGFAIDPSYVYIGHNLYAQFGRNYPLQEVSETARALFLLPKVTDELRAARDEFAKRVIAGERRNVSAEKPDNPVVFTPCRDRWVRPYRIPGFDKALSSELVDPNRITFMAANLK